VLVASMALGYVVVFRVPWLRSFFELEVFWSEAWWYSAIAILAAGAVIIALPRATRPILRSSG
jgi:hypothetical protein